MLIASSVLPSAASSLWAGMMKESSTAMGAILQPTSGKRGQVRPRSVLPLLRTSNVELLEGAVSPFCFHGARKEQCRMGPLTAVSRLTVISGSAGCVASVIRRSKAADVVACLT
jgi:hypothetical protein